MVKNIILTVAMSLLATTAMAAKDGCSALPNHKALKAALTEARKQTNGGSNLDMWGSIVDRSRNCMRSGLHW